MKMINRDLVVNGAGTVTLVAEGDDDLWCLYNLILEGDSITADTARKIHTGADGGVKSSTSTRVNLNLQLKVVSTEYDQRASVLRVRGTNLSSNTCVMRGAFHTLELKPSLSFQWRKKVWKESVLEQLLRLSSSSSSSSGGGGGGGGSESAVVLIPKEGLANIFLVGKCGSINHCAKVEQIETTTTVLIAQPQQQQQRKTKKKNSNKVDEDRETTRPVLAPAPQQRKKKISTNSGASSSEFFESLLQSFIKHVDFNITKHVVIASAPGKLKDRFHKYLLDEAQRLKLRSILANKSRFVLVGTASQSVAEILDSSAVKKFIKDSVGLEDANRFKDFTETLSKDENRACYGWKSVDMANTLVAIETLLITDDLFRSSDVVIRKKYSNLVDSVRRLGGSTHVLSSSHESGVKLTQMTGVAATLRFPIPDLDDLVL